MSRWKRTLCQIAQSRSLRARKYSVSLGGRFELRICRHNCTWNGVCPDVASCRNDAIPAGTRQKATIPSLVVNRLDCERGHFGKKCEASRLLESGGVTQCAVLPMRRPSLPRKVTDTPTFQRNARICEFGGKGDWLL